MLTQDERTHVPRSSHETQENREKREIRDTWNSNPKGVSHTGRSTSERHTSISGVSLWYERGVVMLTGVWARVLAFIGLMIGTVLLYQLAGGFPPWAWRFLASVLPQFSALLNAQGASALLALTGLLLLSFSLLVLWIIAVYCWVLLLHANVRACLQWWGRRQRERDADILADAHTARLYEQEIEQQEQIAMEQERQREREEWEQMAQFRARASGVVPVVKPQEQQLESTNATQPLPLDTPYHVVNYVVSAGSDPGKTRKNAPNEDSHFALQGTCQTPSGPQPVGLFVVADGMGGHADGREASRLAVQVMSDVLLPLLMNSEQDIQESELLLETLKDGVHRANLAIYQRNREREHMMGTTLTAALVAGTTAYIVNVGDSRTYLYHANGELKQVTRDHSSVARLVEAGAIEPDDIYTHPLRNQIYRCLGDSASVQVDTFEVPLEQHDTLLLSSDGLWEMVRDPDIAEILKDTHMRPAIARDKLIQAALDGGGADNVSVVVVTRM